MIYPITNNKTASSKFIHKEIINEDEIATYPLESNIPFIKYVDDKDMTNSTEE